MGGRIYPEQSQSSSFLVKKSENFLNERDLQGQFVPRWNIQEPSQRIAFGLFSFAILLSSWVPVFQSSMAKSFCAVFEISLITCVNVSEHSCQDFIAMPRLHEADSDVAHEKFVEILFGCRLSEYDPIKSWTKVYHHCNIPYHIVIII